VILILHAAATWFMTGLIWFVQIVHYPLFATVGRDSFESYEIAHSRLTTYVVAPVMLVELLSGAALLFAGSRVPQWAALTGLVLLGVIWLSTAFVQVPVHSVLANGFQEEAHRRLVTTNWLRTAAWSLRAALMLWVLARRSGV
jgi:uncharacterized membrane protein